MSLRNIKTYDQLNESIWSKIDLQKEFDDINKIAFDGELKSIPLKWVHTKGSSGKLATQSKVKVINGRKVGPSYDETPKYIAISTYYEKSYEEFRNVLAHEMIHLWITQHKIQDNGHHGFKFQDKMAEVNKHGFNVTLKDDVAGVELSDKNPVKKELGVFILDNQSDDKVLVSVMDLSQMTKSNMQSIIETVKYTSEVNKSKYQLDFRRSNYYLLNTYRVTKKFKNAGSLKYYNVGNKLEDLVKNSKLIEEWVIDAGKII